MCCKKTITCESVSYAHPDKIADQLSDSILDEFLKKDPNAKCGIEVMIKDNVVVLGGEVSSTANVNYEEVVRNVFKELPFSKEHHLSPNEIKIINLIGKQSPEIHQGVVKEDGVIGAGDQGFCVGYASNESPTYMPLGHYLAKKICQYVASLIPLYGPDAKSQVTIEYDEYGNAIVKNILVSTMNQNSIENCRKDITDFILENKVGIDENIFNHYLKNDNYSILVNPCGEWRIGGPVSDCGVTGRKIVVDAFGGYCNVGGGAFCVDGDTEYIGEDLKWHKIKEYELGTKVGQWNNGVLEFVYPSKYHVNKSEKMYHFKNSKTIDMVLSENHDIVCKTSKNNIHKVKVKDIIEKINNNVDGFKDTIPCTFEYYGGEGINLTDNQIRLQIAFCADGTYSSINGNKGRINIKKKNKIQRLEWLLKSTNTEYTLLDKGEYQNHYYTFVPPIPNNKSLYDCFKNANYHQMAVIANEVLRWDGDEKKGIFRTTIKEDADFIQFVFSCVFNARVTIMVDDRVGKTRINNSTKKEYGFKSVLYEVFIGKYKEISMVTGEKKSKMTVTKFDTDKMYCFTVDSGMLLLRRNDKIFVTGNCGKDSSKVDRSAAYMARYIAKNICATGIADNVKVELSYAISVPEPTAINIELDKNCEYQEEIVKWVKAWIDLTPNGIIKRFDGSYPRYFNTARNGHYGFDVNGNEELAKLYPWEIIDNTADSLKIYLKTLGANLD